MLCEPLKGMNRTRVCLKHYYLSARASVRDCKCTGLLGTVVTPILFGAIVWQHLPDILIRRSVSITDVRDCWLLSVVLLISKFTMCYVGPAQPHECDRRTDRQTERP